MNVRGLKGYIFKLYFVLETGSLVSDILQEYNRNLTLFEVAVDLSSTASVRTEKGFLLVLSKSVVFRKQQLSAILN